MIFKSFTTPTNSERLFIDKFEGLSQKDIEPPDTSNNSFFQN